MNFVSLCCRNVAFIRQSISISPHKFVPSSFCAWSRCPSISSSCSDVISILEQRGLIESTSALDEIKHVAKEKAVKVYCGFDPTADSLHLGNLLAIVVLTWFQRCGHQPCALIGAATGRVGDPSGKQIERPILSETQLQKNADGIQSLLIDVFKKNAADGDLEMKIYDNMEWFGEMKFLHFLRTVGKYARLGTMLSKESVKTRLASDSGISFTEFTYQLLQGYDFYHLCQNEGVSMQIGGSDQWGNITAGIDLVKKLWPSNEEEPKIYALTFPLLLDSEGRKFGKSENGAIWLSPEKLSPYKFYQYLYSTTDKDVIRFLKMLTFLSDTEIESLEASMTQPEYIPNSAQRRLAEEVTRFVHGEDGLQQAITTTEVTPFLLRKALRPGSDTKLDAVSLLEVGKEAPNATLTREEVVDQLLTEVMVKVKMLESKGAVRRMIKNGGVRINNEKVKDEMLKVSEKDLIDDKLILLAAGKKNKLLLTIK